MKALGECASSGTAVAMLSAPRRAHVPANAIMSLQFSDFQKSEQIYRAGERT